jgi:hypothetical protein
MVIARRPELLDGFRERGWNQPAVADHPLTDDFADLLRHLRPGAW